MKTFLTNIYHSESGKSVSAISGRSWRIFFGRNAQMKIQANNKKTARRVLSLFASAEIVISGGNSILFDRFNFSFVDPEDTQSRVSFSGVPLACKLTQKASQRNQYIFSLHRLARSFECFSVANVDQDPTFSNDLERPTLQKNYDHYITTNLAESLFMAWGALEELRLTPKAKDKINGRNAYQKDGVWLQKSEQDLGGRLRSLKIDPNSNVLWASRGLGRKTFINTYLDKITKKKTEFQRYYACNDFQIRYIDAILIMHQMRNQISAHAFTAINSDTEAMKNQYKKLKTLSAYEVLNTQHVARTIFLEAMKVHWW
jgi:hypothetical protein